MDLIMMLPEVNPMRILREIKVIEIYPPKPHFSLVMLSRYLEGELISQEMSRDAPAVK